MLLKIIVYTAHNGNTYAQTPALCYSGRHAAEAKAHGETRPADWADPRIVPSGLGMTNSLTIVGYNNLHSTEYFPMIQLTPSSVSVILQ